MKPESVTIQMKASKQYFPVVLFIMLYKHDKVIPTFQSVNRILQFGHSAKGYWAVLFYRYVILSACCADMVVSVTF